MDKTLENALMDIEAMKVIIACLVDTHPQKDDLRRCAESVLLRYEATLVYSDRKTGSYTDRLRTCLNALIYSKHSADQR